MRAATQQQAVCNLQADTCRTWPVILQKDSKPTVNTGDTTTRPDDLTADARCAGVHLVLDVVLCCFGIPAQPRLPALQQLHQGGALHICHTRPGRGAGAAVIPAIEVQAEPHLWG
jgi:hypothetical protein